MIKKGSYWNYKIEEYSFLVYVLEVSYNIVDYVGTHDFIQVKIISNLKNKSDKAHKGLMLNASKSKLHKIIIETL